MEASWEESDAVAEHQEVPDKEASVETIGTWEDQCYYQQWTMGSRNPRKRWTKNSVVQGILKGWTFGMRRRTQLQCNNTLKNWGLKDQLHLGSKRAFNNTVRRTLGSERKKWWYTCRIFRINSLKERAMWHIDLLLANDLWISIYTATVGLISNGARKDKEPSWQSNT